MDPKVLHTPDVSPGFDHFAKTSWTVSRGLRPARLPARQSQKNPQTTPSFAGFGPPLPDMTLLEIRTKTCLQNADYNGLLETAKQILEINSHCASGWLYTGVALLGLEGVSADTPFLQFEVLSPQKRLQINIALRSLHTASICQASTKLHAEIYVMKALARFSLGQLKGAYHDLQFALRYSPDWELPKSLMQNSAMQALHRKQGSLPYQR